MDEVVVPLMGTERPQRPARQPRGHPGAGPGPGGLPPGCQRFRDALLDQGVGEGISLVEDLAGAGGFLAGRPRRRAGEP